MLPDNGFRYLTAGLISLKSISKSLTIVWTRFDTISKSPLSLFAKRGVGRDFQKQCPHYFETVNNYEK